MRYDSDKSLEGKYWWNYLYEEKTIEYDWNLKSVKEKNEMRHLPFNLPCKQINLN